MRADVIGVVHPEIVDRFAGGDFDRDLGDEQAFVHQLVVDLDARDVEERLGQHFRFIIVNAENFRDRADFHALERGRRLDEPFHLRHLLIFAERRRLELGVDPLLGRVELLRIARRRRDDRRARDRGRSGGRRRSLQYVTSFDFHFGFLPYPAPRYAGRSR